MSTDYHFTPETCRSVWHTWGPTDFERFPTCSLCGKSGADEIADKARRFADDLACWRQELAEIETNQQVVASRLRHPSTTEAGRRVNIDWQRRLDSQHRFAVEAVERYERLTATYPLSA